MHEGELARPGETPSPNGISHALENVRLKLCPGP